MPAFLLLHFRFSYYSHDCKLSCNKNDDDESMGWKVSRNAFPAPRNFSLERSGCRIIGFYSRNPRSWAQQVSNLRYSNPIVNESFKFHIVTIINSQSWMLLKQNWKKQHEIMHNTFIRSLIIWQPAIETPAQGMNEGREPTEGWTVPPSWKLYFNPWRRRRRWRWWRWWRRDGGWRWQTQTSSTSL